VPFSIAPLTIVLVSIFGLVLQDDGIRNDVVNAIIGELSVSTGQRPSNLRSSSSRHRFA
jgi:hypothetical protein